MKWKGKKSALGINLGAQKRVSKIDFEEIIKVIDWNQKYLHVFLFMNLKLLKIKNDLMSKINIFLLHNLVFSKYVKLMNIS